MHSRTERGNKAQASLTLCTTPSQASLNCGYREHSLLILRVSRFGFRRVVFEWCDTPRA
jgi:hypothetical protein